MIELDTIVCADALDFLRSLPDESVNCCVTSPPYFGLRSYLESNHPLKAHEIGLEDTPQAFVQRMVTLFREVRRVLRADGTCWINLGDSYAANRNQQVIDNKHKDVGNNHGMKVPPGLKPKDLCGIPWRVALALQDDGWWLRSDIVWAKPNPMPESVTDRPTKAHEYIFLLTKSANYWYDADAIREETLYAHDRRAGNGRFEYNGKYDRSRGKEQQAFVSIDPSGRNKRTVWTVATQPYSEAHFASYPLALIDPCVKAGCPPQVCVECGEPWERVTEVIPSTKTDRNEPYAIASGMGTRPQLFTRQSKNSTTIGWQPTCDCHAETRPGIVYDPFMGAGTTALAAIQNNRHYIGSELNPDYVAMANQRIARFDPYQDVEVQDGLTQLSLFGDQP